MENFRTISLTTHASKILSKIIYGRMQRKAEEYLDEDQFGFRKSKGTREAILTLRVIIEKRMVKDQQTFIGFVDLEKAFDNVYWNRMLLILIDIGVLYNDRRVIYKLYKNETAAIKFAHSSEKTGIIIGVKHEFAI